MATFVLVHGGFHGSCVGAGCTGGGFVFSLIRRLIMPRTLPPQGAGWRLRRLPTSHEAMITMPHELAPLLLEAAEVTSVDGPRAPMPRVEQIT